jgi:hypothetical protein
MFGYARLFRSRWSALLWAVSILYLAYNFAGTQASDDDANGNGAASSTDLF